MVKLGELKEKLAAGTYDAMLQRVYCTGDPSCAKQRLERLVDGYRENFGADDETRVEIFSAPGRTELGGNHTDHQHGCVLAASVNLDVLGCAAPNGTNKVRILSEGYPIDVIDLTCLTPIEGEVNRSAALIRGVAAGMSKMGYAVAGFDAYTTSNVLKGSGLSSSAAFEVLVGVMMNHLFCHDALDAVTIAKIGQYAENVFFGKPCGLMDQTASSVGSVVAIDFKDNDCPQVRKVEFDFAHSEYALCIIDSGADHADLTDDYAAIPTEMKAVAACFGKSVLREVEEEAFYREIPRVRQACGDRALLRAIHFFQENSRAPKEAKALERGDLQGFLQLVKASGISSYTLLQNVNTGKEPREQSVAAALALAEYLLRGEGAVRVHGGGFAGTIQAFVPFGKVKEFSSSMDRVLGQGACHVLSIRPVGGTVLIKE